ncbi:MAG: hypothetical protein AUG81_10840 [Verrucomicrobia bacterium 13_1_20CM_4_54_11]|nr:MAG: hypothetical protein AUG81_10840 [Verrucomicrobia bacterium 13_1_20CM_4_54_11]
MKDLETARSGRLFREHAARATPPRAVIGLEAEFNLLVNGRRRRPEKVFGDPSRLVRRRMIPRTGKSFQSPAGGAIYFDTGVIEVATPIVELEPGCCYRATRLLWEQIRYLRVELDHWAKRNGCECCLQGFSTHYNFSFPNARRSKFRNATKLAYLLTHILPVPVILLATNRQSSAVGVRPRRTRLEVTADFTPDPALMLATCAFIAGAVETVLRWEDFGLRQLDRNGIPRITPFRLRKHSSRRGWRVTVHSFGRNPFAADISAPLWKLRDCRLLSLRAIAAETLIPFRRHIRRISDSNTTEHIAAVFAGDARSLLDFEKRPETYDDVGKGIDWGRRRKRRWSRSKYEKIIHRVIAREPMRIGQKRYRVIRMNGWYQVDFREIGTNRRRTFNLDELVQLSAAKKTARAVPHRRKPGKKHHAK